MSNTIVKSFKFRAYVTRQGHQQLDQMLIDHCELYNAALENRKVAYKYHKESISKFDQFKELTLVRQDDPKWDNESVWLARGTITRVDRAFSGFFSRVKRGEKPGYPRFKSRSRFETLELNYKKGMLRFNAKKTKLITNIKGIPRLEIPINKREVPDLDNIKTLTITKKLCRIDLAFNAKIEIEPLELTGQALGIDLNVSKRVATSDGEIIPRTDTSDTKKKRLQRSMSRAQKGSNNRKKKVKAYAKECAKVAESNKQATHRLTSYLIKTYDLIALEKLLIKNMTKSNKGTEDNPGTNVKAKSGLNREILANRWGMLRNQLNYKAEWAGKEVVLVNPKFTSQICSNCGIKDPNNRQGEWYSCSSCDFEIDADINAAINILRRGLELIRSSGRVEVSSMRTVKCSINSGVRRNVCLLRWIISCN